MTRTYFGLLDDFAQRHNAPAVRNIDELNDHLVSAALVGEGLLINDGYVVAHRAVWDAVLQPNRSVFRDLVETGFVTILSRNGQHLESVHEEMVTRDILTGQQLREIPEFTRTYLPQLAKWSSHLNEERFTSSWRSWPSIDTTDVFKSVGHVALSAAEAEKPEYAHEVDSFRAALAVERGTRTNWEAVGGRLLDEKTIGEDSYRRLMSAANESYQYAWGCALSRGLTEIRVATQVPRYLQGLASPLVPQGPEAPTRIQLMVPDVALAWPRLQQRRDGLANLVSPGHVLNDTKHEFLTQLLAYYATGGQNRNAMEYYRDAYERRLSETFACKERVSLTIDCCGAALGALAGPLGTLAGLLISGVTIVLNRLRPEFIFRHDVPQTDWFRSEDPASPRVTDLDCYSSFSPSAESAVAHTTSAGPWPPKASSMRA